MESSQNISLTVEEKTIGQLRPGADLKSVVVSSDSRHLAYVVQSGTGMFVVKDDEPGPEFGAISKGTLAFSPDGRRLAYMAAAPYSRSGYEKYVVIDGIATGYPEVCGDLVLSQDGTHVAYCVERLGKRFFVVDGKESEYVVGVGTIRYSPDSSRLAFATIRNFSPAVQFVRKKFGPSVAPDDDEWLVVVNGVEGKGYNGIGPDTVTFSPDSLHIAYTASERNKWFVVLDGTEGKKYRGGRKTALTFSPDSQHIAYIVGRGEFFNKYRVIRDEEASAPYSNIKETLLFSPDSQRLAYVVGGRDWWSVVIDDKEGPSLAEINDLALRFSRDSKRFAYAGRRYLSGGSVIVDGAENTFEAVSNDGPIFSPNSARVACAVMMARGSWSLFIDGSVEGPRYDAIGNLAFSPDSQHVACTARRESKEVLTVDGVLGPEYDRIVGGAKLVFDTSSRLHTIAIRDGQLLAVEARIEHGRAT